MVVFLVYFLDYEEGMCERRWIFFKSVTTISTLPLGPPQHCHHVVHGCRHHFAPVRHADVTLGTLAGQAAHVGLTISVVKHTWCFCRLVHGPHPVTRLLLRATGHTGLDHHSIDSSMLSSGNKSMGTIVGNESKQQQS